MTRLKLSRLIPMACAFLLSAALSPGHGAPVEWTLSGVTLRGDGARTYSAVGSFLYDAQRQTIYDWDIVTKEDTAPQTFIFTPGLPNASASRTPGPPDSFIFNNASGFLTLVTAPLDDAGGTRQLVAGHLFGAFGFADADVTSGALTGIAVPDPTRTLFIACGLAALFAIGWFARQQRGLRRASSVSGGTRSEAPTRAFRGRSP